MPENTVARALQPYICGGTSAMFASLLIHPIDLTKTRLQLASQAAVAGKPKASVGSIVSSIMASEGIRGMYSGLSAALMRQAVYGTARIGLHKEFTSRMKEDGKPLSAAQSVGSSMLA